MYINSYFSIVRIFIQYLNLKKFSYYINFMQSIKELNKNLFKLIRFFNNLFELLFLIKFKFYPGIQN